jgi:hypothetical protein
MSKKGFDASSLFISTINNDSNSETGSEISTENSMTENNPVKPSLQKPCDSDERKSKRLNLLIQPTLFESVKQIAYVDDISVNEAVNEGIRIYVDGNKKKLSLYAVKKDISRRNLV